MTTTGSAEAAGAWIQDPSPAGDSGAVPCNYAIAIPAPPDENDPASPSGPWRNETPLKDPLNPARRGGAGGAAGRGGGRGRNGIVRVEESVGSGSGVSSSATVARAMGKVSAFRSSRLFCKAFPLYTLYIIEGVSLGCTLEPTASARSLLCHVQHVGGMT